MTHRTTIHDVASIKLGDTYQIEPNAKVYAGDGSKWVEHHVLTMDQMPTSSHSVTEPQTAVRVFTYRETAAMHIMAALCAGRASNPVDAARMAVTSADELIKALNGG